MARLRIYELARELEMNNKDLVSHIRDLGIQVKGHMSSLDEEQAQLVRDTVSGRSQQLIVEKRVRRGVIRRRRKVVRTEPEPEPVEMEEPAVPEAEAVASEEAVAEKEAVEEVVSEAPVREEEKGVAVEAEKETVEPVEAEISAPAEKIVKEDKAEKPKPAKEKVAKKPRKRVKKETPAKIIKLPERVAEPAGVQPSKTAATPSTPVEPLRPPAPPAPAPPVGVEEEKRAKAKKKKGKRARREVAEQVVPAKRKTPSRRKEVFTGADLYGKRVPARGARGRKAARVVAKEVKKPEITVPKAIKRRIKLEEAITVANLARRMGIKAPEVIKKLMELGMMTTLNQALDYETAALVASEFDYEVEKTAFAEEDIIQAQEDREEDLQPRPPVVTIMGHVDHGKTSLLDAIRHTNVIEGEAGGITQHIGAYYLSLDGGDLVFLDTPGHEAFTAMRARGARITDLVVIVVAADDGVMQQTVEAINHAQAADIPILVAINKMDKPNADPDRVRRELAERGLSPEEWGGTTTMVEVSAKTGQGLDDLLELIQLQAELLELKANPNKRARGRVIEAKLDRGKGPVATVLVQEGTLHKGDPFVCGNFFGKVRAMVDDRGRLVQEAGPSMPVEVHGISGVPQAGDEFVVVQDDKEAKQVAFHRQAKQREIELSKTTKVTLDNLFSRIKEGETKELRVVLKTDVQGSLEAITDSLAKLSTEEVKVNVIHSAVGAITESDVMLASASDAIIIGFNVRADLKVQEIMENEKVDVRYYDVIYQIIADVKSAMEGMLEPIYKEHFMGRAEVLKTFHIPRVGTIAGCMVHEGKVEKEARVRVLRDNVVVNDSKVISLRRYKDDVKEVRAGQDCGIGIENFNDIKVGDVLETYSVEEIKPVLEPSGGGTA
ncbi:MAG: translation initiation factor IF-2 [Deltaproteobacteria bacterium]|nr:translation initiation factor IF-2 [Deltaproteobacteria bacterium]MBW2070784.1 translation initiation factor IF-2 [Deltaproteobacteria bacterium]